MVEKGRRTRKEKEKKRKIWVDDEILTQEKETSLASTRRGKKEDETTGLEGR